MKNKRAQNLSTNSIILIVLGVIILIVLIVGFTAGWDRLAPWIKSSNVDSIKAQCDVACSADSEYEFCSVERELKTGDTSITASCYVFATDTDYSQYGIDACSGLCVSSEEPTGPTYTWVKDDPACTALNGVTAHNNNCDLSTKELETTYCCKISSQ